MLYFFLRDSIFTNKTQLVKPTFNPGGLCTMSQQSLSYMTQPITITDDRLPTARVGQASNFGTVPTLVFDQNQASQFYTEFTSVWTDADKQSLFAILDAIFFSSPSANDAVLSSNTTYKIYQQGSLLTSTTTSTGTAYTTGANTSITAPTSTSFTVHIANGNIYTITVYVDDATFIRQYPLSTIVAVIPPLSPSDLYNSNIVETTDNIFNTALKSTSEQQAILSPIISTSEYSGMTYQDVRFVDNNNNYTVVQFNILYKGAVPGILAIRQAISNYLVNSGVGTQVGWASKCPELFTTAQFFIIPIWNNTVKLPDQVIYPGVVSSSKLLSIVSSILYDETLSNITTNMDIATTSWNDLFLAIVPGPNNPTNINTFHSQHPTYMPISSNSPNFVYMAPATRIFSSLLSKALVAASGGSIDISLSTTILGNRTFISFTIGNIEYDVLTTTSYNSIITG